LQEGKKDIEKELETVKGLIKPIDDEDGQIANLKNELNTSMVIKKSDKNLPVVEKNYNEEEDVKELQKELDKVRRAEDKKIEKMQEEIRLEAERKQKEIEEQRAAYQAKIDAAGSENEKKNLMKQLDKLNMDFNGEIKKETDAQNSKLREALKARRQKKKALNDKIGDLKNEKVKKDIMDNTNNLVNGDVTADRQKQVVDKIKGKFGENQKVQVAENYLDSKNQQEMIDLMNSLFEQRTKALRHLIAEINNQKVADLEALKQEFEPQYEFLR